MTEIIEVSYDLDSVAGGKETGSSIRKCLLKRWKSEQ